MVEGYCVRCKEKVELTDPVITRTKRGGFIAKGKCSKCKVTTVCSIMSQEKAEKAISSGEAKKGY